jgi:crotonobetainyl-CoA:carnitine CoA-transferase CaiB-like acyl-CoA transferase
MYLADWGAEVIRVESRQHWQPSTRGRLARPSWETVKAQRVGNNMWLKREPVVNAWNRSTLFNLTARNKLSMTVDLTRPEGRDIFKRLIEKSDIFIESNAPSAMESLNLTYPVIKGWKPDIIMLSLPGFGQYGPYKHYRAFGAQLEAWVGHTYLRGYRDMDLSMNATIFHIDDVGGMSAAFAMLMALHYRNRTGKGQFIDLAQAEAFIPHIGQAIMDYTMNKRVQERMGNRSIHSVVQGCYLCRGAEAGPDTPPGDDNWVNITITSDAEWEGFCRVLGYPAWTKEECFSDQFARLQHHDELDKHIEAWTRQHDKFAIMHLLQKEGVPAGPVMVERDAYSDPHLKEIGFFQELTQADCGTHLYPGLAWRLSKTPNRLRLPPVRLGEHNEYVYKKVIGVSDEEYAGLEAEGHIGMDFVPEIP